MLQDILRTADVLKYLTWETLDDDNGNSHLDEEDMSSVFRQILVCGAAFKEGREKGLTAERFCKHAG